MGMSKSFDEPGGLQADENDVVVGRSCRGEDALHEQPHRSSAISAEEAERARRHFVPRAQIQPLRSTRPCHAVTKTLNGLTISESEPSKPKVRSISSDDPHIADGSLCTKGDRIAKFQSIESLSVGDLDRARRSVAEEERV